MENIRTQKLLDRLAIGLSGFCVLHCLLAPILLITFPVIASVVVSEQEFHKVLILLVLPASSLALVLGCRQHKDWGVFAVGMLGLTLLVFTASFGHDVFGEIGEKVTTVVGGVTLAFSHFRNYRLCRSDGCND